MATILHRLHESHLHHHTFRLNTHLAYKLQVSAVLVKLDSDLLDLANVHSRFSPTPLGRTFPNGFSNLKYEYAQVIF
jgi:hypothetical protein